MYVYILTFRGKLLLLEYQTSNKKVKVIGTEMYHLEVGIDLKSRLISLKI